MTKHSIPQKLENCHSCLMTLQSAYEDWLNSYPSPALTFIKSCFDLVHHEHLSTSEIYPQPSFQDLSQLFKKNEQTICEGLNDQVPLKLLLLGGTGVGKSSLINALAQKEISSVSHLLRAHTSEFVVYLHQDWKEKITKKNTQVDSGSTDPLFFWPHHLWSLTQIAYHDIDTLKHLWLVDAPDIDSIISLHLERVKQLLPFIDLPICVCSPQKYRDLAGKEVLQLIHKKRLFIAIMNQIDRVPSSDHQELLEDASSFMDSLGHTNINWFVTSVTERDPQKAGIFKLYNFLNQRFNLQEIQRIKLLRLEQQLSEQTELFVSIFNYVELYEQILSWQAQVCIRLNQPLEELIEDYYQMELAKPLSFQSLEASRSDIGYAKVWSIIESIHFSNQNRDEAMTTRKQRYITLRINEIELEKSLDKLFASLLSFILQRNITSPLMNDATTSLHQSQKLSTIVEYHLAENFKTPQYLHKLRVKYAKTSLVRSVFLSFCLALGTDFILRGLTTPKTLALKFIFFLPILLICIGYLLCKRYNRQRELIADSHLPQKSMVSSAITSTFIKNKLSEKLIPMDHNFDLLFSKVQNFPVLTPHQIFSVQYLQEAHKEFHETTSTLNIESTSPSSE